MDKLQKKKLIFSIILRKIPPGTKTYFPSILFGIQLRSLSYLKRRKERKKDELVEKGRVIISFCLLASDSVGKDNEEVKEGVYRNIYIYILAFCASCLDIVNLKRNV